jgi:hypothetical protein
LPAVPMPKHRAREPVCGARCFAKKPFLNRGSG